MEEPGCGAQFRAAVQVIQGLPRSGAYRPSYEEMLRFYSYYKQATAGRCQGPRPGFWDPIGRYKWDAWHSLGAMSKQEAMAAYVAEMKKVAQKVIDTVPMDESTQEMFRYFEPLYEVIHDMPRPPEAFFRSTGGPGLAPAPEALEGTQVTSDSDGDTFSDTLEQMEPEKAGQVRGLTPKSPQAGAEPPEPLSAGQGERGEGRRAEGSSSTDLPALGSNTGGDRPRPGTRSTGRVPVAPARVPTHAALPGHLALRHPVAAAPLAGQEEVTPEHRHRQPSSPSRFARSHAGTASAATGTPAPADTQGQPRPRAAAATHSRSRSSPGPGPASPGTSPSLPQLKSHFRFSPAACAMLPGEGKAPACPPGRVPCPP
ncbi:acyl-CoA-binding domain-containing protein 4 isoform X4 [Camarhynchus parvulus]|uniref:acyl-CoA-binding domain-containing protein 4 isoform X4 n=1 Tax=Geospiza parvula TaxID=87175 RepID=UPI0012382BB0|nr:acyl-CoA-binding domain-containing protein 4 isoform X4 [Camarhynchus parvulus]